MNLANPGAGDLSDRLTILALKILTGQEEGTDIQRYEAEWVTLGKWIQSGRLPPRQCFTMVLELAAVNALIWSSQDQLRVLRAHWTTTPVKPLEVVRELAFRLQSLNDRRAQLVDQINNATEAKESVD